MDIVVSVPLHAVRTYIALYDIEIKCSDPTWHLAIDNLRGFIRSWELAKITTYFVRIYLSLPPTLSVFSFKLLTKIHNFAAYFSKLRQLFQNLLKTLQSCIFGDEESGLPEKKRGQRGNNQRNPQRRPQST